jgi:hypothetical protein
METLLDRCYRSIQDSMTIYDFYRLISFVISALEDGHADCEPPKSAMNDLEKHIRIFPMRLWFTGGTGKLHLPNDHVDIFSLLYYIVFGPKSVFTVEYRTSSGEIRKTDLPADYVGNMRCAIQGERLHGLALELKANGVAVLTVGRFDGKIRRFNRFLRQSFAEISRKRCTSLIIDLRNNGGGEDQDGAVLYSYLSKTPFKYYASLETVKRKFRPEEHAQLQLQQPAATPFSRNVYFLINGYSFSGTAEFCAVARSENRGEFCPYSALRFLTGLAIAARMTCKLTVARAMISAPPPEAARTQASSEVR